MKKSEILPPAGILDLLIKKLGLENDNQLAEYLGVNRQNIYQFRKGKGGNLTCMLFTVALEEYQSK